MEQVGQSVQSWDSPTTRSSLTRLLMGELLSLENLVETESNVAILRFRRPPAVPPVGLPVCPTATSPIMPVSLSCCSQ